jgi:hypothetical protein
MRRELTRETEVKRNISKCTCGPLHMPV